MLSPMVTLVPMPPDAWPAWRDASIRSYAADMVRVGTWPAEGVEARAAAELANILPQGPGTPGHEFRSIVADDGTVVGHLWFGPASEIGRGAAFILDIAIVPGARGRGYGRAALLALEPVVRALGYDSLRLHVFGDNEVARNLYRTSGYVETDVSMRKTLT